MPHETSVLFVCLGNICRSPLAEGIFRSLVEALGMPAVFTVDSAGTSRYHIGNPPHPQTQEHARKTLGLDISSLKARQVRSEDFNAFDYVVAMDRENLEDLRSLPESHSCKNLALLSSYARTPVPADVPDPYFGGDDGFGITQRIVEQGCRGLLQTIQETWSQ